ncbi:hypothetical protein COCCADRAFT_6466 [Bipolaris zeicola 26-R-13]|uniref:Uncharacterized protein n=1 Tax=Cochliobolus carbonum (strain 26-R-13) TaxID=930089 RepID=W6YK95_COCC2|nr:uncharacterized protein COCCADRAFT_6466 [Bipolaris zeicola 26-R-13]EUC31686.1 hypothetical protein COCCADRAFT_6466 [Bipolaris zeicola 26-R-13]
MQSKNTPQPTPPPAATPTAAPPPRAAAPTYTMSCADARRKQQLRKQLNSICEKVATRSKALIDTRYKYSCMEHMQEYKLYVFFEPEVNLAMLSITCEHQRQQIEEVVKAQLEVARWANLLTMAEAEEKRLDAEFWALVNKYKKG